MSRCRSVQKAAPRFHSHHAEEDWRVTLADTGQETMTGGRIRRIRHYLGQDREFLLTYGDCVGNIDIAAALQFHRKHGKKLTLTAVRPPGRFGELALDDRAGVTQIQRKTPGHRGPRSTAASSSPQPAFSITSATATR